MTEPRSARSSAFARSDISSAAEEFVFAAAEALNVILHPEDIDELSDSLTDKAMLLLRDPAHRTARF